MKPEILEDLRERTVKNFMDLLILAELNNSHVMSGYDVISFIHKKFHILMSSGTVYSVMYSLERNGLVEGRWNGKKRVYKLTNKGEETIKTIVNAHEKIQNVLATVLKQSLKM